MRSAFNRRVAKRFSALGLLGVACGLPLGCGADDKFAAQTDDEYKEPLTNAVIGTPTGVLEVAADGRTTITAAGKAGATGAGGATSTGGSVSAAGAGGSVISAGSAGVGAGVGAAGEGPSDSDGGFGQWHFDDCSPKSHFLADSSGFGANAQQPLKASCVPGINGLGVQFRSAKDVVQVPDEPQFTVDQHVGVAAWVNPKTVSGDQPIVIKRLNNKTAFSLGIHNGNIEMSVVLKNGTTVISRAPIAAKKWTHVAGMFDGTFVFLFINGQQFGQVYGAGTLRNVFAPIRIGATTETQFFNGTIDEVFLTTQTITPDVLTSLACISQPSSLTVNPVTAGPVQPNINVHYDLTVTNNDVGACLAKQYDVFSRQVDQGISVNFDFPPGQFALVSSGAQAKFGIEVSGSEDADPGLHNVPLTVEAFSNSFEQLDTQVGFELSEPSGCFVSTRKELMITNVSVVDDPIRTAGSSNGNGPGSGSGGTTGEGGASNAPPPTGSGDGTSTSVGGSATGAGGKSASSGGSPGAGGTSTGFGGSATGAGGRSGGVGGNAPVGGAGGSSPGGSGLPAGAWSFGHLMRELAPTPDAAPALTLKLLQHWLSNQTVNGFTVAARPAMQQLLIDIWPKTANGELDLDQSPLTLQAIVNRVDIRNLAEGSAGEGRLVYGVNGPAFSNFTVIAEYNLVAHNDQDVADWANRWHALGSLPFPSEAYNAALETITRRFTDRNASPGSVNGSALVELRTNEIALSPNRVWELRSFALSPTTGTFEEVTVKETPDLSLNNTAAFASVVNQNAAAIIAEVPGGNSHTIPEQFNGGPFLGGSVFNDDFTQWNGPGIADPDARFHASLNTCNGCHSGQTNTAFLMVTPRRQGSEASLSPFLTGTTVFDQVTGQPRTINDLGRRKTDLTALVCTTAPAKVAAK